MNIRLVLDTSAVLAYFQGSDTAREAMNQAEIVYLPSVSVGELYFGARKCSRPTQEEVKIEAIIDRTEAIDVDYATARVYGAVIHQLESEGKRIPLNDIWIAAMAMQHGCTLLARDAHFDRIEGLNLLAL